MDEATSALDNESEYLVSQSLEKLAVGRTTLTIAHRLTTIQGADRILVLAGNKIVKRGIMNSCWRRRECITSYIQLQTG